MNYRFQLLETGNIILIDLDDIDCWINTKLYECECSYDFGDNYFYKRMIFQQAPWWEEYVVQDQLTISSIYDLKVVK